MCLHGFLLQHMLVVLVFAITVAPATAQLAKPGCPDRCGDLINIPYPFGIKDGCYLNEDFLITCNQSVNPPQPFWSKDNIPVTSVSLQGQLHILPYKAHDCYDENGTQDHYNAPSLRLSLSNFVISDTQNKFVAVGCDTFAFLQGYRQDNQSYITGCVSTCNNIDDVTQSCSGTGCCQVSIPKGLRNIKLILSSFYNHSYVSNFNPCSYAFVIEEKAFDFSPNYINDTRNIGKLPMVLDWGIGNETCHIARKNATTYACKGNTACHDLDNMSGYRCTCLEGYQGNPYLNPYLNGCQDIDECNDLRPCEKSARCRNEVGKFTCFCPKGYNGDGRKDGKGCIANRSQAIIIGAGIGGLSLLVLLLGGLWLYKVTRKMKNTKLKEKYFKRNGGMLLKQKISSDDGAVEKTKIFNSKELEKATDNFNENRIIGQGGQGIVYKGMLTDGSIVAIKKSRIVDESQLEPFINEVTILSQINHRNVVKLLGCCLETEVPLLVYEFISNGTLFQLIHNQDEEFPLSWELRIQISLEVSGVLAYLHSACSVPIYHRDIKSTNILLDDKYRAKVSDFGISRTVSIDQTHLTTHVQGTCGYVDPEYFRSSQFTEKSDVYSFGVVLVELLTGLKPITSTKSQEVKSLVAHFLSLLEDTCLFDILDARVIKEGGKDEIMAVSNLAMRCLNLNGKKRPTMKEVTIELERIKTSRMPLTTQQNFQEGECSNEMKAPSDGSLASTSSYLEYYTQAFSLDVHPLLNNTV